MYMFIYVYIYIIMYGHMIYCMYIIYSMWYVSQCLYAFEFDISTKSMCISTPTLSRSSSSSSPQSGRRHIALRGRGSEVLQPLWWSIGDGLQVPGIVWFYYINHMIPHVWWEKRERPDNRYKNYLLVSHVSGEIGESHMFSGRNYKNDV